MYVSARDRRLWNTYGIREHEFVSILEAQGGVCFITGKPKVNLNLNVDHQHIRGFKAMPPEQKRLYVRGVLHHQANRGLGYFSDNPEWLRRAALYLEDWPAAKVLT